MSSTSPAAATGGRECRTTGRDPRQIERFPAMRLIDETPAFRPNPQSRDMESLRVALAG